ncbi:MAG: hypothetical protein JWP64_2269 [Pseudonocardia sp.]|uniref:DUF305 domain-containing protein n=1 Tax=Pseudonocardia sp. TaxID=60912 RepID=UPI002621F7DD|nr:DUF305 domain-containing protein [Pseudonocardia sp.]MCU1627320.1 hypothetical protein [Pseudonocardia sp.]MDT7699921.1 hypothetical protein [Pseudonocardiales bacterium]
MNRTSVLGMLAAASTAVVLAGCSNSETPSTSTVTATPTTVAAPSVSGSTSAHDDADVAFAQGMIPHHSQAVDMAGLAADRAGNDRVKQLAASVENAQGPEIEQLRGFLAAWGQPEAPAGTDHAGMGHSSTGGSGMTTDAQMQQLEQARGADFDRMFLQMMTAHHEGAVEMARTELAGGRNPEAKALAQKIIDEQQAEIATMANLLSTL